MSVKTEIRDKKIFKSRKRWGLFSGFRILLVLCCGILALILFKSYEQSIFESRRLLTELTDLSIQMHRLQHESNSLKRENSELRASLQLNANLMNELKLLLHSERKQQETQGKSDTYHEKPSSEFEKSQYSVNLNSNEIKKLQEELGSSKVELESLKVKLGSSKVELESLKVELGSLKVELGQQYRKLVIADEQNMQTSRALEIAQNELRGLTTKHNKLNGLFTESEKIQDQLKSELKVLQEKRNEFDNHHHHQHHGHNKFSEEHEHHHRKHHHNCNHKKHKHGNRKKYHKQNEFDWGGEYVDFDGIFDIFNVEL